MISTTTFKSVSVRAKLMGAMRRAKFLRQHQAVYNRKGGLFLTVERVDQIFRCFKFTDVNGTDVTELVYGGLKQ